VNSCLGKQNVTLGFAYELAALERRYCQRQSRGVGQSHILASTPNMVQYIEQKNGGKYRRSVNMKEMEFLGVSVNLKSRRPEKTKIF